VKAACVPLREMFPELHIWGGDRGRQGKVFRLAILIV
jgi:hypothetical protein